ncbi:MAG TPA: hypothetical protein VJJ79_01230 [Candidatus Nanoarchaeia archaeon]|nr:hypothetical protein [Candidatus Nanoarchaeia archaeon]
MAKKVLKRNGNEKLKRYLKWVVIFALEVLGLATLAQGFGLQLATGVLYYGIAHYAVGILLLGIGWRMKMDIKSLK